MPKNAIKVCKDLEKTIKSNGLIAIRRILFLKIEILQWIKWIRSKERNQPLDFTKKFHNELLLDRVLRQFRKGLKDPRDPDQQKELQILVKDNNWSPLSKTISICLKALSTSVMRLKKMNCRDGQAHRCLRIWRKMNHHRCSTKKLKNQVSILTVQVLVDLNLLQEKDHKRPKNDPNN